MLARMQAQLEEKDRQIADLNAKMEQILAMMQTVMPQRQTPPSPATQQNKVIKVCLGDMPMIPEEKPPEKKAILGEGKGEKKKAALF